MASPEKTKIRVSIVKNTSFVGLGCIKLNSVVCRYNFFGETVTFEEALQIMLMSICTGFGLEFSKWFFEKIRKVETKVNGKH